MNPLLILEQTALAQGREWTRQRLETQAQKEVNDWGNLSQKKADRVNWKEVKAAVIYRLEQRVEKDSGRRMLLGKFVVAAPPDTVRWTLERPCKPRPGAGTGPCPQSLCRHRRSGLALEGNGGSIR